MLGERMHMRRCFSLQVVLLCASFVLTTANVHCERFFYGKPWPEPATSGHRVKLCQTQVWMNSERGPYFATLFDVALKIPVYSASVHKLTSRKSDQRPPGYLWDRVAKRLCSANKLKSIIDSYVGGDVTNAQKQGLCRDRQALTCDYHRSGYHRGHLEPSHINRVTERMAATFTLTNAAPQNGGNNVNHWRRLEQGVEDIIWDTHNGARGKKVYVITGTGGKHGQINNRVAIPRVFWKAVCFPGAGGNATTAWSFGYWMWNRKDNEFPTMMYTLADFAASFPLGTFPFNATDLFGAPCPEAGLPKYYSNKLFYEQ